MHNLRLKKLGVIVMVLLISNSTYGCQSKPKEVKSENNTEVIQTSKSEMKNDIKIEPVKINGDKEYINFYEEHVKKIQNYGENKLNLIVSSTPFEINMGKPYRQYGSVGIGISIQELENKGIFTLYSVKYEDESVDEFIENNINLVNDYFKANFNVDEVKSTLKDKGIYSIGTNDSQESYGFNYVEDVNETRVTFKVPVVELNNVTNNALKKFITEEEVESIGKNDRAKIDEVLESTKGIKSDKDLNNIGITGESKLSYTLTDLDIELSYIYLLTQDEISTSYEFEIPFKNKSEVENNFKSEQLKGVFSKLYGNEDIYNAILEKTSLITIEKEGNEELHFSIDTLGDETVTIHDESIENGSGTYYIKVNFHRNIK